jgi:hypothetical protein
VESLFPILRAFEQISLKKIGQRKSRAYCFTTSLRARYLN